MNDSVDMARDEYKPPQGYDQNLLQILRDLISNEVSVKVCGTCMSHCSIYKSYPYFNRVEKSTMEVLIE